MQALTTQWLTCLQRSSDISQVMQIVFDAWHISSIQLSNSFFVSLIHPEKKSIVSATQLLVSVWTDKNLGTEAEEKEWAQDFEEEREMDDGDEDSDAKLEVDMEEVEKIMEGR